MVNARLRNPDLAAIWQELYRVSSLTPGAKQRLLRKLQALDADPAAMNELRRVEELALNTRAQLVRLHELTQGVVLPDRPTPGADDVVATVDFVSALVLTARQLRQIERDALTRKGFELDGRSTHEALLEVLDQFADVAQAPSMGAADDVPVEPPKPPQTGKSGRR